MKAKKLLVLVVSLVLFLVTLAGCAPAAPTPAPAAPAEPAAPAAPAATVAPAVSEPAVDKKPLLGVSLYFLRDEYYKGMESGYKAAAEEFGFDIVLMDADTDISKQTQQIEDFMAMGCDVIALAPCDPDAILPVLKKAIDAGIGVIIFDGSLKDESAYTTGMIMDFQASGKGVGDWAANYINEKLGGKAKVAVIEFAASPVVGVARVNGFLEPLELMEGVEIVAKQDGGGDRAKSMAVMEDILTAHPDVDIVFGVTDGSGMGAVAAIQAAGNPNNAIVLTYGYGRENFEALADKTTPLKAFACDLPQEQARAAVQAAAKIVAGEQVTKKTDISFMVLDEDSIAAFDWKSVVEAR